jgi:hypothetical protein
MADTKGDLPRLRPGGAGVALHLRRVSSGSPRQSLFSSGFVFLGARLSKAPLVPVARIPARPSECPQAWPDSAPRSDHITAARPRHPRDIASSPDPAPRTHLHHSRSAQRTSLPRRFLALANCARPGGGRRERPPTDCTCEPYEVRGLQVGGLAGWPRVTANERSRRATPTRSKDARRRRRAARRGRQPLGAGRRSGTSTLAATGSRCKRALSRCCYRLSLACK